MPDYIQVLKVRPNEGSRDFYRLECATVHLYARADSEAEAIEIMNRHLDRQEWTILEIGKAGTIDTSRVANSSVIGEKLRVHGYCADIHFGKPRDDIGFSKN